MRSLLNRAFFTKLYVDGRKARVVEHELRQPFDVLAGAYKLYQDHQAGSASYQLRTSLQTRHSAACDDESGAADQREDLIASLASVLEGQVSSNDVMVGAAGFEPAAPRL